jgi:tellurite resistance protein TerC
MRFAAGIFSYAIQREPILKPAAYILVLNIGLQLIVEQLWKVEITDVARFVISVGIILGSLVYAHSPFLQKFEFIISWFAVAMGMINKLIDLIFLPFKALFQWGMNGFRKADLAETK